jgi:acetamidase/formamidase
MEQVDLSFHLHANLHLTTARANTPFGWLTFGFHEDLNEAAMMAVEAMVDLMGELYGVDRHHELAMASVIVDLRITQIVNQIRGVHAVLPHRAIAKAGW